MSGWLDGLPQPDPLQPKRRLGPPPPAPGARSGCHAAGPAPMKTAVGRPAGSRGRSLGGGGVEEQGRNVQQGSQNMQCKKNETSNYSASATICLFNCPRKNWKSKICKKCKKCDFLQIKYLRFWIAQKIQIMQLANSSPCKGQKRMRSTA